MSDIYLQITETPTVVTLSAPVISGALSSTVTVANTVTVALDSNSLSALENVTVTVGAAITGTVTVSNFPATQPVSIASVTIGNTVTIAGTVTANPTGTQTIAGTVTANNNTIDNYFGLSLEEVGEQDATFAVRVQGSSLSPLPISGTVTANVFGLDQGDGTSNAKIPIISFDTAIEAGSGGYVVPVQISNTQGAIGASNALPISGTVTANPTGTQTIAGTVTASNLASVLATYESSAQENVFAVNANIGGQGYVSDSAKSHITNSVTIASLPAISGTVTVGAFSSVSVGSGALLAGGLRGAGIVPLSMDVGTGYLQTKVESLPALVAGTAQIGSVTASISNSVTIGSLPAISGTVTANTFALQGTAVTTSNFTSTTASTVLANFNAGREVLTIFNEGAGLLFVCPGATCTTVQYQVRLSSGDYWEAPNHQSTITHSAVFSTAGTARIVEIS